MAKKASKGAEILENNLIHMFENVKKKNPFTNRAQVSKVTNSSVNVNISNFHQKHFMC